MQFLKEFKVSEILCVTTFDIICAFSFDKKCVHHTMEMPYGNCIKLNNHQCSLSQLKAWGLGGGLVRILFDKSLHHKTQHIKKFDV
jgi:hypothetical protein